MDAARVFEKKIDALFPDSHSMCIICLRVVRIKRLGPRESIRFIEKFLLKIMFSCFDYLKK